MIEVVAHVEDRELKHVDIKFPSGFSCRSDELDAEGKEKLKAALKLLEAHGLRIKYDLNGLKAF